MTSPPAPTPPNPYHRRLGDFTTDPRVLVISAIAVIVATASVIAGVSLMALIRLVTNIAYFGKLSLADLKLEDSTLGAWVVLLPVAGALVVGLMARYGSEKIRGHGIPEAIEAILLGRSRISRKRRGAEAVIVGRSRSAPADHSARKVRSS